MKKENYKGADLILDCLEHLGVDCVFGMPGTQTLKLYDSLLDSSIKSVLVTNELFAAFMANGYGYVKGIPGVCFCIPGPGLTNLFSGLAQALTESIPMLVIVVGIKKTEKSFLVHEIEQLKASRPLVKENHRIEKAFAIPEMLGKAYFQTISQEPGPVLVEIAEDVLREKVSEDILSCILHEEKQEFLDADLQKVINVLQKSKQCGIYVGQGVFNASEKLLKLAEVLSAPVATTISGKGALPEDHPLSVGFGFGPSGTKVAEDIFKQCDTVLAIGCKFSEMATGDWGVHLPETLIHVDKNKEVLNKNYPATLALSLDAEAFLSKLLERKVDFQKGRNPVLIETIQKIKQECMSEIDSPVSSEKVHPAKFLKALREGLKRDAIVSVDCGYHQLWAIIDFPVYEPKSFLTTPDYQTMGYSIPAAIGAKFAMPDKQVVCLCGDGGFLISGFEILTAVREKMDIKFIIFNDRGLGLIKRQQKETYGRISSVDLNLFNFEMFAKALGVKYKQMNGNESLKEQLKDVFVEDGVMIIEVPVSYRDEPRYYSGMKKTFFSRLSPEKKMKVLNMKKQKEG